MDTWTGCVWSMKGRVLRAWLNALKETTYSDLTFQEWVNQVGPNILKAREAQKALTAPTGGSGAAQTELRSGSTQI